MITRFRLFLGPARLRALFILIATTGLASLILNAVPKETPWVIPVQTALFLIALVGSAIIILGRMDANERGRWLAILLPAFGAVVLALTVLPQFALALFGAAAGWIVAGLFLFRTRTPSGYRQAIRHLRKGHLDEAISSMDQVIKDDPDDANHYRFRAELLRLNGKLDRARRDYTKMTDLEPNDAVGYNGLAEVDLQAGNYRRALEAAQKAVEIAPDEWVALYNIGMIEDRLGDSASVITHLTRTLALKVPDARHRLLIHFYLLRAYARLGETEKAERELEALRGENAGLEEWKAILDDPQAEVLRSVLGDDVQTIQDLLDEKVTLDGVGQP
jgi:tetratricopeptide (TPR) repeat protein